MHSYKVQQGFRLDHDTIEKLRVIADGENRSLNNMVETILMRHIQQYEAEHGPIDQDALAGDGARPRHPALRPPARRVFLRVPSPPSSRQSALGPHRRRAFPAAGRVVNNFCKRLSPLTIREF